MTKIGLVPSVRLLALLVAITVSAVFLGNDNARGIAGFNACASVAPIDKAPNAVSEIQGVFGVGIGPDCLGGTPDDAVSYNTGGLVNVTPPEWGPADTSAIPVGTPVGSFSSLAQLGLLNNPCNTKLSVNFDLLQASTDPSQTISPKPANPDGSQQANRLEPLAKDGNGNGVPDGADLWPAYLTTQGEKNGWNLADLRARTIGFNTTAVAGLTIVLNFLTFEPGSHVSNIINIDSLLGFPSVTVLNDPTVAASYKDPISDFCAPLASDFRIFGQAAGLDFRVNPGDGTYNFVTIIASQPDADNDGIENSLDPCWDVPDTAFDPRETGSDDPDGDGLPSACDPDPNAKAPCDAGSGIAGADQDCDKWQNRGDNCALVSNPDQKDDEPDGIGDACDPDATTRTGVIAIECKITEVVIGAGGTAKSNPAALQPCDPSAALSGTGNNTAGTPTPTLAPGQTPKPTGGSGGDLGGSGDSGIGSLSPIGTSVSAWAALLTAFGVIGVLGGAGMAGARLWRKR